jgi:hypothetical protein
MTVAVGPAIQHQYEQNAAARRSALAEVTSELKARQDEIAQQIKKDEDALAALGKHLVESKVDEPAPARRAEDNDISAKAEAYQEADDEPAAPPPPVARPITRVAADEEEVPSFHWDEDPPASSTPAPAPQPAQPTQPTQPAQRARRASTQDADEDLSEHDWLE